MLCRKQKQEYFTWLIPFAQYFLELYYQALIIAYISQTAQDVTLFVLKFQRNFSDYQMFFT